jgi:hypothetical protein
VTPLWFFSEVRGTTGTRARILPQVETLYQEINFKSCAEKRFLKFQEILKFPDKLLSQQSFTNILLHCILNTFVRDLGGALSGNVLSAGRLVTTLVIMNNCVQDPLTMVNCAETSNHDRFGADSDDDDSMYLGTW